MIDVFVEFIHQNLGAELAVFIAAILPVIEVRGAIPLGITMGLGPFDAFTISFVGAMFPVPFILLAFRKILRFLSQFSALRKFVDRLTGRSLRKGKQVQKYGLWGLVAFVGTPLPGTGVWTGSIIAVLLGLPLKRALPALFLGNLVAALAVLLMTQGVAALLQQ
jgi:uncharacterized membrane protein